MDTLAVAALLTALGAGALLRDIYRQITRWLTGRAQRERARIEELAAEIRCERERADREASKRRQYAEHASELRRLLIDQGLPAADLPAWPTGD